eukprot:TRINITY_DN51424_c0_g1_i1.p2 TRINITY_DN51424_c0_g1~~TRINITY_DN51424_c0_g1_i1.p2  ORF type:complete len:127 (-),score=33.25 TRINITY_DN51424_c0_g1_i1:69-449(-)
MAASLLPRAKDLVREEDVQAWVTAGLHAATPMFLEQTRELLLFAMREHQKVLEDQTLAMMRSMEAQSAAMQNTIAQQGRSVSRLIAFGGLTMLASQLWRELGGCVRARCWLTCGYAAGVLGVIWCV